MLPFVRFCEELKLPELLIAVAPRTGRRRTHPVHRVLFAFLVGSVLGCQRLAHLEWYTGDALLLKFLRLSSWPVRKVFSGALASVSDAGVAALGELVTLTGLMGLSGAKVAVLDFDSTALVSFGEQEGALFGYCGKGRNRRRHHPLVASLAATRTAVHASYRGGSAIKADEIIAFFAETVRRVRAQIGGVAVSIRADAGFWSQKVYTWLLAEGIPFACALPMQANVKLALWNTPFQAVEDDDEGDLAIAEIPGARLGMDARVRVIVLRRVVHDPSAPPPGKVVPDDLDARYQAIATSLDWAPVDVWRFYNDRGDAERVFKTGKHALGLANLVSHEFRANEVAFLLRLLALNLDQHFQSAAERTAEAAHRPVVRMGLLARQPRLYHLAGRLLRIQGRWVLRIPQSPRVESLWAFYDPGGLRAA